MQSQEDTDDIEELDEDEDEDDELDGDEAPELVEEGAAPGDDKRPSKRQRTQ